MHGPTPASIPGGQVIATQAVVELMRGGIEAWKQAGLPVQRVR
jgi:rhodanese-related sulfurtransferase